MCSCYNGQWEVLIFPKKTDVIFCLSDTFVTLVVAEVIISAAFCVTRLIFGQCDVISSPSSYIAFHPPFTLLLPPSTYRRRLFPRLPPAAEHSQVPARTVFGSSAHDTLCDFPLWELRSSSAWAAQRLETLSGGFNWPVLLHLEPGRWAWHKSQDFWRILTFLMILTFLTIWTLMSFFSICIYPLNVHIFLKLYLSILL